MKTTIQRTALLLTVVLSTYSFANEIEEIEENEVEQIKIPKLILLDEHKHLDYDQLIAGLHNSLREDENILYFTENPYLTEESTAIVLNN